MSQALNSYKQAEIMYQILKKKKEISLEDILQQFEISVSTAYNIQRALKAICEKHPDECEIQYKNRKTIFKYKKNDDDVSSILNAQPISDVHDA